MKSKDRINVPYSFQAFCRDNDLSDREQELVVTAWNMGVSEAICAVAGIDVKTETIKKMRNEATIVLVYPHPDAIRMVEKTKRNEYSSIEAMFEGMSNRHHVEDRDKFLEYYEDFFEDFEDGDTIVEYDNVGILCGSRGFALRKDDKIVDIIATVIS